MADTPAPRKGKGKIPLAYPLAGVGLLVLGYVYLRHRSSATAAATGTTGGGTIPTVVEATGGSSAPTTLAGWITAALATMTTATYGPSAALNDVNDWLGGNCVSAAGYTAIGQVVQTLGLPPGYGTTPSLTACAGPPTGGPENGTPEIGPSLGGNAAPGTPPNLSPSLAAAMLNNGETLIGSPQWDAKLGEWIAATDKGGIYNLTSGGGIGPTFYGSYLGLPSADRAGPARSFTGLSIDPNTGDYTLTSSGGQNYTFTPTTPQGG